MAGEGDAERLVVLLEARIADFEKAMERAEKKATGNYDGMRRRSKQTTDQMAGDMTGATARINQALDTTASRARGFGQSFLNGIRAGIVPGIASLLSVGAAFNGAKEAMREFSQTGDVALRLGLDVEALQELRYAAEQGGMAVDNFDMAFRRFTRRAAEAAQGGGAAKDAFAELGIQLQDSTGRLRNTETMLNEVADALRNVETPADRLRLAFKMFDTDGAAMVNVLAGGADELNRLRAEAQELGIVIDRDVIEKASDMQSQFETATRVLDMQFKQVLIELAPMLVDMATFAMDVARGIRMITDAVRELMAEGPGAGFGGNQPWSELLTPEQLNQMRLRLQLGNRPGENLYEGFLFGKDGKILIQETTDAIEEQTEALETNTRTRAAAARAALSQADAVRNLIADLQFERQQLFRTSEEQELYSYLKRVGVERNSELGQEIETVVSALQHDRAARDFYVGIEEGAAKAARQVEDTLGKTLASLFDGPMESWDQFLDKILGGLVSIGEANLKLLTEGLFSANDNGVDPIQATADAIGKAVEPATAKGIFAGFDAWFGQMSGGSGQGAGMAFAGAMLAGTGNGYPVEKPADREKERQAA